MPQTASKDELIVSSDEPKNKGTLGQKIAAPSVADAELRPKRIPLRALQIESYLRKWSDDHGGRINPRVGDICRDLGIVPRTVQVNMRVLEKAGRLVRLYTGGRGQRLIYMLGPQVAKRASEEPSWERTHERGGKTVRTFGELRMTRKAQQRNGAKSKASEPGEGDRASGCKPIMGAFSISDRASDTSYSQIPERDPECHAAPTASDCSPSSSRADPPPTPPLGGTDTPTLARRPEPEHKASSSAKLPDSPRARTPDRSRETHEPPGPPSVAARPPRGPESERHRKASSAAASLRPPIDPTLWAVCWQIWREEHRRRFGRGPVADPACEVQAMKALCRSSLREGGGVLDLALNWFAWGVIQYLLDGRWSGRVRTLRQLAKLRVEYGHPPIGWVRPWVREQAKNADVLGNGSSSSGPALPKNHSPSSSSESSSSSNTPIGGKSRLETAREVLARTEHAFTLGLVGSGALKSLRAEVDRLSSSSGSGTADETK